MPINIESSNFKYERGKNKIHYSGNTSLISEDLRLKSVTLDILLDDRGYPVCDKSIEALALLERNLLNRPVDTGEAIYRKFLDPRRMKEVKDLEAAFYRSRPAP